MSVSDRGPSVYITFTAFSGLHAPRVAPLIRESSRDCVSPPNRGRTSMVVRRPVPVTEAAVTRDIGSSLASSVSRIPRRSYLPVPDRRMFHGNETRGRPCANRGENKTRQDIHARARAPLGVRKTWFTVRRGSVVHTRILASPAPRDVLIWTRSRGETRRANIFLCRGERTSNYLLGVAAIRRAPCVVGIYKFYTAEISFVELISSIFRASERM